MKTTKRFILTLAAILGMTGAWAQDTEEVAVTKTANNNEWTLTMPASDVELQVEYYMPFDLTLADGSDAHGTVAFTVGDATATQALKDDVVTVNVTPAEGYSVKEVTAQTSSQVDVTMSNVDNGWTFTMPEDKVTVTVTYAKNLKDAWIQAIANQTYTGSAITPTVTVKDGETTLVLNTDYTVAYSNNVETGTATVTVTGTGNYSGTATANFTIVADKSALNTAITEAETYYNSIKDDHAEAAAALKTAIDNAKTMQEKGDATQEEVNNALSTLTTAKTTAEQAVLTETKNELGDAITAAETYYESIKVDHTEAATALQTAIDNAKTVKDKADATQSEVDAAIAELAAAKTTAEQTVLTETKNELNDAIDEAEGYYNSIKESNPTAAATFLEAINNAKAVKDNADATQEQVDAAIAALTGAKTTAEQTVLTETKDELNDDITEAEAYYNSIKDSNPAAAATLLEAINAAKSVKDNADATQEQVDAAIAALAGAKTTAEQTVLTETKDELNDDITEAEAYYNSIKDSNPEAAATLLDAINAAKTVKDNGDATQEQVDAAIAALAGAVDAAYEAQGLKRITLTEQYGTYCLDKDLDFSETTGLTAYIAAGYNKTEGSLLMVKVTSVPAGTGLLLKRDSEASGTFTAKMITSSPYIYSNLLTGTTKETDVTTNDLILSKDDEGQIGFYRVKADGKIAANKAYLKGLAPATGAPRLTLEFLDDATDIAAITSKPADANRNSWYTLDGRKLQGAPAKKGIYLLNGKKVIVR